jgi:hypothetical protein
LVTIESARRGNLNVVHATRLWVGDTDPLQVAIEDVED